uniref:Signal recognition particle subunit SRP72 n=1 Tax=Hyaloperonospora arabidopsidis (strain Emoy2) TaxID=559515 RepID=M4BRV4_HYAAE
MASAVSAEAAVAASFSELNAALKRENYTRAVDICNKIRSKVPDDVDAIRVKCVALIRLEKFDKALELATKYDFLSTEKAYCLYRRKQDDEALTLLKAENLETQNAAQLHLAGQLGDDILELQTNLLAAYANAGRGRELKDRKILSGDWDIAEKLLVSAKSLCRDAFVAEGASENEIEEELAVIKTQLAYVKQMRGDVDGALSDYGDVLKLKLHNRAAEIVASNNIVTIRKDRDLMDSFKRLKNIDITVLSDKLSPVQQEAIVTNRTLLLCLMSKTEECRESLEAMKKQFAASTSAAEIALLLAIKDQSPAAAIEQLQGDASVGGRLGLAHVYMTEGKLLEAAECIRSVEQLAHSPGVVATLVALYEQAGDSASAQGVLESALAHYKASDFTSERAMTIREGDCWYKIQKKQYRKAADAYIELLEGETAGAMDRDLRLRSMASLVVALSFCDAEAAEARCAMLPAVEESGVDPLDLEKQAPRSTHLAAKFVDTGDKKSERRRSAKSPENITRKRTKRREAYLAKLRARPDYNASIGLVNPDPERWIPRKQRSHGKRGRRGRNRFVGAQGAGMGTEKDALKLDAAARAARKTESDKPTAVVVSSGSGIRKLKKKKRR